MELNNVLVKRKSIRKYESYRQISESQLSYILTAGMAAPISHKDYGSIKIAVVQDKKFLRQIADTFGQGIDPLYGVPTLIVISTKTAAVRNIECFNCACVVENMLLAATDLELGSIFLTAFLEKIQNRNDILSKLGLDSEYEPIAAVGVGYKLDFEEYSADEISKRIEVIRR